jgi:hypothetical protein
VSFSETVLLGAPAGFTIYLGLPLGDLRDAGERARGEVAVADEADLVFAARTGESKRMPVRGARQPL